MAHSASVLDLKISNMAESVNTSNPWAQTQSPLSHPSVMDFSIPGSGQVALSELLALGINSYAPVMLLFGFFTAARSYIDQFLALLEKHFS